MKVGTPKILSRISLGETRIQIGARADIGIIKKFSGIESDFGYDRRNRIAAFDIEFLFPESIEHAIRVRAKLSMPGGVEAAIERKPRAENLFRWIDDQTALLRDSPRVDIQIPNLAPVGVLAIERAVHLSDVHSERNETHTQVVRQLEVVSGLHRKVRVRTRVREIQLDFVKRHRDAIARKSARWTTLIFDPRRRSSAAI